MSTPQQRLMKALYDALYVAFAPGGEARPDLAPYLSLSLPGTALEADLFAGARSLRRPQGSVGALEAFSRLVDPAPALSPVYMGGARCSQIYRELLDAEVEPGLDGAPRPKADRGLPATSVEQINPEELADAREEEALQSNREAASRLSAWHEGRRAPAAPLNLRASLPALDAAGTTVNLGPARDQFKRYELMSSVANTTFLPTYAYPVDWMQDSRGAGDLFNELTLDSGAPTLPDSPLGRAADSLAPGFVQTGGERGFTAVDTAGKELRVTFKFLRVLLDRPWLDRGMFSLKGLRVRGRSPGDISTGTREAVKPGVMQLYPTSIVVAKDIIVEAAWTARESESITAAVSAGREISAGPFRAPSASFAGDRLTFKGLSLVGYLSTILPFCPPRP
jgi:hypothetical protein